MRAARRRAGQRWAGSGGSDGWVAAATVSEGCAAEDGSGAVVFGSGAAAPGALARRRSEATTRIHLLARPLMHAAVGAPDIGIHTWSWMPSTTSPGPSIAIMGSSK